MASRKEYEMLFALNARMNGGFSNTFSKAQQEFSKLGKEIQELQRVQSNISSYQKQQTAIEGTRSKLENLKQQHDLLQKEIGETTGSTTALEREKVKLEQRIKDTETALDRQTQKLQDTGAKLREAGVDTSNLAQKDQELTAKIRDLQSEQDKAANSAENFGNKASQAFDALAESALASEVVNALGEIKDAFMDCVEGAGSFEEAMSTVEALSQANAQDMAALNAEAKELGATTKFTAKESADAMGYMAMAGWDAADMLQGMDGVLQLAAASGEDLAMVSDIVTDSLSAFGLTAKDTAHFSDVLAAAATNSNTNVAIMGETFKMSASVAGALGYSIEDVATAMGLMANSGVKGSIAGTALRNTFNGLLEGVTLTGAAFGEYEYSAVKADGTMKSFGSSMNELRGYFEQMTEAERVANAQAIAGQRGYNGLLAILNATEEDYASLTESINNCTGAAQRMADVKLDNMNGQLTLMDSAWDALKTTIGEEFIPEMRSLYKAGTDVFSGIDKFVQENPGVVKGVAAGTAVIGAAALALTGYTVVTKAAAAASTLLSASIPGVNIIMGVVAGVAALTAVVVGLNEAAKNSLDESWDLTAASREQYEQLQELNSAYDQAVELYGENSYEAQQLRWQIEDLNAAYEDGRQTFEEYTAAHEAVMDSYRAVAEARETASTSVGNEAESIGALIDQLAKWSSSASEAAAHQGEIQAIVDHLNESLPGLNLRYNDVASGSDKFIASLRNTAQAEADAKRMAQEYENYVNSLSQRGILEGEKNDAAEQVRLATEDYEKALAAYNEAASMYQYDTTGIGLYFGTRDEAAALDAARAQMNAYQEILDETTAAYEENEAAIRSSEDAIQGYTNAQEDAAGGTAELGTAIENTMTAVQGLVKAYNEAYTAAQESISGQYALWDDAAEVVEVSAGNINTALESQITYWDQYNQNLESLRERTANIEGLSDVIASFADGSADSVNAIAGMANASDEDLAAMVQNWQDLQQAQADASQSIADLKTDFSNQMDELQTDLAEDIEGMELSEEAKAAGEATIQGYINAANAMLPQVQEAYKALADGATGALWGTPSGGGSGTNAPNDNRGYATGTESAQPGWAWVGENGPELLFFNGGEKVLNASQSAAVQAEPVISAIPIASDGNGSGSYPPGSSAAQAEPVVSALPVAPAAPAGGGGGYPPITLTVQVQGNATTETVDALSAKAQDIVNMVLDALDERTEDEKRCSMR